ncbi:MAG: disulfide bond formation protein DsbA [Ancylobacter novellus]|uniref:Disulfide bond formation protein DsbA n=1 Tax=Ancylobacter novellus TaxID=921 RepID=A0A2W5KH09_ANCNO|nr:MAG: disulfide bond formation protein DsbA [Ancylobacter novellus]
MSTLMRAARAAGLAIAAFSLGAPALAAPPSDLSREMIVADPAAPVGGAADGDVTIVAFVDYNCGFCKKSAPALDRVVKDDGKIRLVYKDWPILAESSVYGAKLALAAKYQGRYEAAHRALMALKGGGVQPEKMEAAVAAAGVDMARLKADAASHEKEIVALLKRNDAQARGMLFQGTPVYLVGPLRVAASLDYAGFKDAVAQARARNAGRAP